MFSGKCEAKRPHFVELSGPVLSGRKHPVPFYVYTTHHSGCGGGYNRALEGSGVVGRVSNRSLSVFELR